jgi:DNA-binding NarL/FixJ family response regulator
LLDFDFGTEHGNDFMPAARQAGYLGRFLILTDLADVRNAATALKLGASGIFLKSEPPDRLVQAIRLVGTGGIWLDQTIMQMLADRLLRVEQLSDHYPKQEDRGSDGPLDDREKNVLLGIVGGLTNRKIGDNLSLSESCVKNTVQQLFRKAGVKTRVHLVRVALEGSLGGPPEFTNQMAAEMALKSHE